MRNTSENRTRKKNNSPQFSNITKKNTTAYTVKKKPMIIIGQEHVTPYKHVEKVSVYRNYDADEENEVDGIKNASIT